MNPTNGVYISLVKVLSELSVLRQKTLDYHWNVTGESFYPHHLLFERLYDGVSAFIDRVAEQARAYGKAPGTFSFYLKMSSIEEETTTPSAEVMVDNLIEDFNKFKQTVYEANEAAKDSSDLGVENLLGEIAEAVNASLYLLNSVAK